MTAPHPIDSLPSQQAGAPAGKCVCPCAPGLETQGTSRLLTTRGGREEARIPGYPLPFVHNHGRNQP